MILQGYSEKEIDQVAQELIKQAGKERVWCFYGEMGAGKTTLIKAICHELGVIDPMSSPTFAIVNEYLNNFGESLYHFDFYRLKTPREALNIGIEDYFYSDSYCFIEWPEKISEFIPESHIDVVISSNGPETRSIELR